MKSSKQQFGGKLINFSRKTLQNLLLLRPTCDSTDVVCTDIEMELMKIGDVMYFANMGAYSLSLRTPFNGLQLTNVLHFIRLNDW